MAKKEVGITLALGGEKEYTQGFSNAVKVTKMLQAETKSLAQEFEGSANSMQALQSKQENLIRLQDSFKQKLNAANTGLGNARKQYEEQAKAVETLKEKLDIAQKSLDKMKEQGEEGSDSYKKQEKAIEELNNALTKQTTNMLNAQGRVTDWNKKVIQAEADVRKNSKALEENRKYLEEAKNSADGCATSIDEFGKSVKQANTEVDDLNTNAGEAGEVFTGIGEKIASAVVMKGVSVAADALGTLKDKAVEAAEYVVEVGSSFEAGMSEVEAISGATGSELETLESKAKSLGSSTKFSATEVAGAMTNMSLAGWSVNQTLSGIDGVLQLAAASNMDLADASQVVTDNISSFNLEASQSTHIADMMAYAQANSSTTAAELGEAYKNCGANMNAAGQDIETTTSFLEALANNGLRGSEAGTSLAAVMRDMTSKMKDGKIAIGDTSVAVMDSSGNFRDMTDILKNVENATDGMGDAQKQAALMSTFTSDSIKGLNMLLNTGADQVAGYEDSLRNCSGAASDMADTMQDNLQGKLTELSSATEGLGIAVYDYISGPLQGGVELLTDVVSGLTDAITPQKDAMEDMYDSVIQSSEDLKNNMQSIDDQFTGAMNGAENVGNLATRLEELNNVQDRTTVQRQEMAAIVDQLSQSIPELQGAYDSENDTLSVTNEELEKLVKNYQQTAVQQAVMAATQDLVNQKLEAQVQIDKAEDQKKSVEARKKLLQDELDLINQVKEHENDINIALQNGLEFDADSAIDYQTEALKMYKQALDDGVISLEEYQMAEKAISNDQMGNRFEVLTGTITQSGDATGVLATSVGELQDKEDALNSTIEDNTQLQKDADESIQSVTDSAKELFDVKVDGTESTEDNTKAQEENADAINATGIAAAGAGTALEGLNKTMERSQEAADAAKTAMRQILDEYNSTMDSIKADLQDKISFADKFDGGDDITTEQMNENLQSWVDGIQNYQQNLQRLKEATDESGQAIFSAEFIQAIQEQGTDAANMLQHMVWTLDNQGEYGVEQLKGISKKWTDAMDISEDTATVMAANKTAYELAVGELGSTDYDFSDLRESIDNAVASAVEGWAELPAATQESLMQTVQMAQECGVQIPEGLADGIASGEITPQQAIDQLNGTIEGTIQGVAEIANKAGIQIPEEIQAGINAGGTQAVSAMQELLALIQQQAADAQSAGEDVGTAVGEGTQNSIKDQQSGVEQAGGEMASAGAKAAEEKKGEYEKAGTVAAQQYQTGINSGKSGAISASGTMASQAAAAVRTYQNSFYTAGYNAAAGVAQGISAGQSQVISASIRMINAGIAAAKAAAEIHSPSKKFEKEVGYQLPAGTASGITKNTKVATAAAGKMSQSVLKNATSWLKQYNKSHEASLDNEKWYWQQIRDTAVKGSTAYKQATAQLNKLNSSSTISKALSSSIKNNFGVSKEKVTGSGDNQKKTTKDAETYNSEVLSAAEKRLEKYKTLHATSLAQEKNYWTTVRKNLKSGTDAWYEATQKIQELDTQIYEEKQEKQEEAAKDREEAAKTQASVQKSLLETYQTYYSMSARAEMEYWNIARKQFTAGTDERIEADKKYLEAKEDYEKEQLQLDEDYNDKREKLEKELNETIQDLEEKRDSVIADRKKDILSSMNNYDAWDASGYTADRLIYNMNTQVEGLKLWENQLQELSGKGLSEGLLQELKDAGPEAAANIYSLNQMTAEQLDEFNKLWEEKQEIADRQAKKDTQATRDAIDQQISDTRKDYKKQLDDLAAENASAVAKLNEGLSTGLKSLVEQAGQIGEDIVGSLIAGIQKAGTGGTLLDVNVSPAGKNVSASSGTSGAAASSSASSGSGTSGNISKTEIAPAQKKELDKVTVGAAEEPAEIAEVQKLINASKAHKKSVSDAEKKKHSDLWQYIVKKYGRSVNDSTVKKIADALSVEADAKPSSKQKKAILAAMKKRGLRTGAENILEDQLAWLFENNAQEYVLRKSDGAIMQNMLTGDKVINPQGAENLYNFATNPDQFLADRSLDVGNAGIEKLNRLIRQQSERQTKRAGSSQADNADILSKMDSMMRTMEAMTESMISTMKNLKVFMDKDKLVGEIREDINIKNEMAATRHTRGRLR
ncbi:phage tail tape measure protein [Blautia faecis]|uniref:phage tail tape measure protein n=1 Tax=Blautia faecis TaxID=871665 RepID=UPI0016556A77|nr:phage tail tape measure protein [Blautia faecis]MBC8613842.1 phage tail tape measure protein [Blautia faecis]